MLFNTIDTPENKLKECDNLLKKLYSDNLKGMLYIYIDNSNKLGIIVDDLGASTLHALGSEFSFY
jgi:hypothetical protein